VYPFGLKGGVKLKNEWSLGRAQDGVVWWVGFKSRKAFRDARGVWDVEGRMGFNNIGVD